MKIIEIIKILRVYFAVYFFKEKTTDNYTDYCLT